MAHRIQKTRATVINAYIAEGKANQALEGLAVTSETETLARQMLNGQITPEEARKRVLARYGVRTHLSAA